MNKRGGLRSPSNLPADQRDVFEPIVDVLNRITGVSLVQGKVQALRKTATLDEVIAKVNELIDRIQED